MASFSHSLAYPTAGVQEGWTGLSLLNAPAVGVGVTPLKDRLPFDVWVAIAAYLSVQSIVNLRRSCKGLYDILGAHSVWSLVFRDIMRVMPHHVIRHTSHLLSTQELRQRAVRAAQIDRLLDNTVIQPAKVRIESGQLDVAKAMITPGGTLVLTLHEDGSVQFRQVGRLSEPPVLFVNRPESAPSHWWNSADLNNNITLSSMPGGKHLMIVSESFDNLNGEKFVEFRIYHLVIDSPSIRLLTTVTQPERACDSNSKDGLFAVGWEERQSYFLRILRIPFAADEIEEDVVMDLGSGMAETLPMIKILCPHLIVLSTHNQIFVFAIPKLLPDPGCRPSPIHRHEPLFIYGLSTSSDIWNNLCCHRSGRLTTASLSDTDDIIITVWPPVGQSEHTFIRHTVWRFDINPSRAIWVNRYHFSESIELCICTHLTKSDDDPGYMRLGRSAAPDPSHVVSIPLVGQTGFINDLSWDEESGRICVLVSSQTDGPKSLLVVDMA